jgi:protein kinase A
MISQKQYGNMVDWYMFGCFVYEMITGRPPFFAVELDDMWALIKEGHLSFPKDISPEAKDLIKSLMKVDPKKRLGAGKMGFAVIKSHPFFSRVNWQDVLEYKLPTPVPIPRPRSDERISRSEVYGTMKEDDRLKRVFGWSFASDYY